MAQAQLHKKMLTLNVTNRIIMKITVWLIPTRQRFDNCLLKKFNYKQQNVGNYDNLGYYWDFTLHRLKEV
jgi:hypothetical protein